MLDGHAWHKGDAMNVAPRAPMNRPVTGCSGETPLKRPGAASPDAGFAFEQALQARSAREPAARQPVMRERPPQAQATREQPVLEPTDADTATGIGAGSWLDPQRRRDAGADGQRQERDSTCNDPPPRPEVMSTPGAWPAAVVGPSLASATCTQPQDNGPTRAALAMALDMVALPVDAATAGRWEVSIPQAGGAPLELQACRAPLADGSAGWRLDIRSRARNIQSALARSAARLSDRLEARSLSAQVRIEDDEGEAP